MKEMTYADSLAFLERLGNEVSTAKFGLENIRTLCDALGNPEQQYAAVLIAGTNGKGSTAATLHSILQQAGRKVACFTSPHLVHPRERIRIGADWISEADFAARLSEVEKIGQQLLKQGKLAAHPTYFETLTAAAYLQFAQVGTELAVLEVGMGGRLDATNISRAALTLITSLSLDHQQHLGPRIEDIAYEKAGIFRRGVPALVGPMEAAAAWITERRAREVGAPLCRLSDRARVTVSEVQDGFYGFDLETRHREYRNLDPSLRGPQQPTNTTLAVLAAEMLQQQGYPISSEHIREGIRRTNWPGRMQVVRERPRLLLDGAHNPEAVANLRRFLEENFSGGDLLVVFGAMRDKNYGELGEQLFPPARGVVLTQSRNTRAAEAEVLHAAFRERFGSKLSVAADVAAALQQALAVARDDTWIVLTGSLYLVGEALEFLGLDPTRPLAETTRVAIPG